MTHDSPADGPSIDLTMGQAALWFGQTLDPDNPTFNVCDAVELTGEVDLASLTRAAHLAVTESDALTARFVDSGERVRQLPGAWALGPPVPETLAGDGDPWSQLHPRIREWTARPHDLTSEPGVQQWILQQGDRTFWVLAAHHALIDAYGLSLVFGRGAEIYRRLRAGADDLGRPLGTIRDVVTQDLEYLESDKCRADAEFWADRLAEGATAPSGSEAAQARSVRTARTTIAPLGLSTELKTGLSTELKTGLSKELTTRSWPAAVTAAVAAYLARRTGERRQTLGFLLMNRLGLAAARVPTSAVNLAPLTVPTGPAESAQEIIDATAAAMRPLSAHQRHRGERIGDGGTLTAGFARRIGTVVNVKPFASTLDFGGPGAVVHSVDRGPVQDFSVTVAIGPDGRPEVIVDADARSYDEDALHALLAELVAFIESFTAPEASERPLASFGLLTPDRRAEVLVLGDGGENPEGDVTTLEMFDATAAARPDDIALVAHDSLLSYGELAERSRRIGAALAAHGVGPDQFVAIVAESSAAAVAAIHGTWRAGGAYVPVDPKYPADRIAHQLADCAPRVVLVAEQSRAAIAGSLPVGAVILDLDRIADGPPAERATPPIPSSYPVPDSAAYMIYTSGSTGLPKGVVVSHRSLSSLLGAHRRHTITGPRQRVLSTHTLSFDSSVSYMAWMTVGHTLHLIDRADVTTAELVVDYVREHRIDFIDAVPVLMDAYVRAGMVEPAPGRHIPQCLSTGGEAFPPHLWAELADRGDVTVFNLYGPTEGTVDTTFARVADTPAPSIGRPAPGGALYVLDRHLHPVAEGETGELYVAGPQLARGYHRMQSLTAQRFVANPSGAGDRLYRTGDLVRWNRFGSLDYLGRSDEQVQIAGYRVEFGEVESLVARAAEQIGLVLDQVVADVRTSRHGVRRLVGYVALAGDRADEDFGALRDAVAELAPAHLVPALFVPVERVPLSPAGKTDRAALPDPWSQRSAAPAAAGGSPAEVLCGIFGDLLDLDDVGPDDDFFSLGGDSIIAIGVTSRARALGLTVTPRQVFELRTARALAAEAADDAPEATPVDPARAFGEVPPTPLMRRVLRNGHLTGFAQARVLRVPAGADAGVIGEALTATAAAHPMFSAHLDDGALQVPSPTGTPIPLEVVALTAESGTAAGTQERILALARDAAQGIDPARGPLLRAVLVRGLPAESDADALIVVAHHLAVDGVSWRILTEDLRTAYDQASAARAARIPAEGTSFREWARTLGERAGSAEIADTAAQWEHPGTGPGEIAVTVRPLDPTVDTAARVERREVDVPAEQVVSALPTLYNTGPTEVLLATLSVAVAAVFGRPDAGPAHGRQDRRLFVDLEGHGRDETLAPGSDLSRTVGWFTAFWPVPIDLPADGGPTSLEAVDATIKQVKERLARPQYSGLEYGLLTELRAGARPRPASPVLFNYLGRLTTGEGAQTFSALWPSRPLLVVRDPGMPVSHPLEVNAITVPTESGAVLRAEISWASTLIGAEQVEAVVRTWTQILGALDDRAAHDGLGGITPSDSLIADLTQDEIDEFAGEFA
ncbi:amino acid adenylation domain-containing protein [Gordonia iterans]